jgi:hypothetical protein
VKTKDIFCHNLTYLPIVCVESQEQRGAAEIQNKKLVLDKKEEVKDEKMYNKDNLGTRCSRLA